MFVAAALRKGPNLQKSLHGGSVACNAIIYRHRPSPNFVQLLLIPLARQVVKKHNENLERKHAIIQVGFLF